jgi:hypothetical protein
LTPPDGGAYDPRAPMPVIADRKNRIPLHLDLGVSGRDVTGAPFAETTRTLNVSAGGLCFGTAQRLFVGGNLTLHIQIPPPLRRRFDGRAVYRVRAIVCRLERVEGLELARAGVRFLAEIEA